MKYEKEVDGFIFSVYEMDNRDLVVLFQNDELSGEKIISPDEDNYNGITNGDIGSLFSLINNFKAQE